MGELEQSSDGGTALASCEWGKRWGVDDGKPCPLEPALVVSRHSYCTDHARIAGWLELDLGAERDIERPHTVTA